MIPTNTTLHQLTTLNFRLKKSLEDKRKAVIKKLLESKVAREGWNGSNMFAYIVPANSYRDWETDRKSVV